jgi:hypothetical protein
LYIHQLPYVQGGIFEDWKALFDTTRHWKHFTCSTPAIIEPFFSGLVDVAHLEELFLTPYFRTLSFLAQTMTFPQLTSVKLYGDCAPATLCYINAPRIRSLTISGCTLGASQVNHLSSNFKTLSELRLDSVDVEPYATGSETLSFPSLQNLHWSADSDEYDLSVFQTAPRLRSLTITAFSLNGIHAAQLHLVTELHLHWADVVCTPTISRLYTATPYLLKLHLSDVDDIPDASDALRPLGTQTPMLCPKLNHLILEMYVSEIATFSSQLHERAPSSTPTPRR